MARRYFRKQLLMVKTVIGSIDLETPRTGETHKTSAASVVLFDKDKQVVWQAP